MNYGKAVEEVWAWRETFEKELREVPRDQQVKYINETAQKACKKLGIKCRRPAPRIREHGKYDFASLKGRLRWKGNALKEQKRLRSEW